MCNALRDTVAQRHEKFPVAISEGSHPFPSRTRKLSPPEPMVLRGKPCGRVGRCRIFLFTVKPVEPKKFHRLLFVRRNRNVTDRRRGGGRLASGLRTCSAAVRVASD